MDRGNIGSSLRMSISFRRSSYFISVGYLLAESNQKRQKNENSYFLYHPHSMFVLRSCDAPESIMFSNTTFDSIYARFQ